MRFLNLYWRTIKDRAISWPTVAVSVIAYVFIIVGIYPAFANNPAFAQIIKAYPKAMLSLLAGSSGVDMLSPEGFISLEFLQLWGMLIIAGFVMTTGASIVAREIDNHTMDLLLTQPIDRVEYLVARLVADITMMLGLVAVTMVSIWLGTKMFDFPLKVDGILAVTVLISSLYLMIECFSLAMGTFMERGKAIIVSVSVLIGSHLLNSLGDFNDTIKDFRWLSLFNYYQPSEALRDGAVPWGPVLLFTGFALVFLTVAVVVFREKDIPA
ncbi:MAG: ABC transporter permease subunit [Actinomycetota bacterium]